MTRGGRTALGVIASIAGAALLAWYVRRIGVDQIAAGFSALGAGVLVILALSVARFVVRAAAWIALLAEPVPFGRALAATMAGDALGNITPVGPVASEPAKALYLADTVPAARGLAALMAENFFYFVTIAIYMLLGAAAMVEAFKLPAMVRTAGLWSIVVLAGGLIAAAWLAWRKPAFASAFASRMPGTKSGSILRRVRKFEADAYRVAGGKGVRVGLVVVYECLFHVMSFLEAWFTVYVLTGASHPVEAFVLDAFSRLSNAVFRLIPLRLGVDQAGSGLVSHAIGLGAPLGATLSLVRTARVLLFAAIGMGLLAVRSARTSGSVRT